MDSSGRSRFASGQISSFTCGAGSVPTLSKPNFSANTKIDLDGPVLSRSHFMSSTFPTNTGQGYHDVLERPPALDVPLDAFDKELLATEEADDRHSQASQGLARPSLPHKSIVTPRNTNTTRERMREELHATPRFRDTSSSSPGENASSPTVVALSQRRDHRHHAVPNLPSMQDHSSPLSRNDRTALSAPCQARGQRVAHSSRIQLGQAPPVVQGIPLVSVNELPDRFRSLFPFALFNAVQSKCFATAYKTNENMVLSAPTGSGKTVIMELAMCQLMQSVRGAEFKIVYQAPTKALCSERCTDWQAKLGSLDVQCAELTGDTDASQMRNAQAANVIVTTPEKWDSITRRWKDHAKLMQLVKLFLIDEVHILKESRGATLEAVVSRMKSTGSSVRFVALSATVPNSEDVATWLGKNSLHPYLPAHREVFGEDFRPVQLQKVAYGYPTRSNDFAFDKMLESKLPEIIAKHSRRKPVIIFCPFRKSCVQTAKSLAELWLSTTADDCLWSGPSQIPSIQDNELRQFVSAGVAFHHAGLDVFDRRAVEQAFLSHDISIICCTSTLAVGVNLPCYLVVIKGTAAWSDNGCQEYADLEMMQMLGRAGRPQFEQSACAVILTRTDRVDYYNRLVSGQEPLESCLHLNLIDHLNAEIGLGTVTDLASAKRWLASTFLFVRLGQNPNHYRLKEDVTSQNDEELLEQISSKDIALLRGANLVTEKAKLSCTEFGDAMGRYYVKFDTMKILLSLAPKAKLHEIMTAIAQAAEFRDIRLKSGEKSLYKRINKDISIKFPVQVDIALSAHKVSLIIQAELGGMDFPVGEQFAKLKSQFQQDKAMVFQRVNRLVRCVIDCQLTRGDSVSARNALELARCFASRVWDNSPLQLKQLDQIGNVAVRKLANAGINSIESLENTEAHRIETVIGRGPPFGLKLLTQLAQFPKLRVLVKMAGKELKPQRCIKIRLKAEIGFLNENVPVFFRRKPIFACFLAETSDGQLIDFRRIAASKLRNGHEVLLTAELMKPTQYILCHVMCDEIAGTCRSAEMRPGLPLSLFPTCTEQKEGEKGEISSRHLSSRQSQIVGVKRKESEDFDESGLDDRDLLAAENVEIVDIDAFDDEVASLPARKDQSKNRNPRNSKRQRADDDIGEPIQMKNGKWACNHKCKDKAKCKHLCCKEGLDKPPKSPTKSSSSTANDHHFIESMLDAVNNDSTGPVASELVNSQNELKKSPVDRRGQNRRNSVPGAKEVESLAQLHKATTPFVPSRMLKSTSWNLQGKKAQATPSSAVERAIPRKFANKTFLDEDPFESDWVNEVVLEDLGELTNSEDLLSRERGASGTVVAVNEAGLDNALLDLGDDDFDFDDNDASMLEAGMVGLDDSMQLKEDAASRQIEKDDSHSNTSFSSRTVRSLSPTRAERSKVDDLFDGDDGIYDFDQEDFDEADPVQHRLSKPGADGGVPDPSNNDRHKTSPPRKLFFTSPERPGFASPNPSVDGVTSSPRRNPNSSELAVDVRTSLKKIPDHPAAGSVSASPKRVAEREIKVDETTAARELKQLEEEEKLLKKHGIDRSFYDEFKDFVDFI